MAHCCHNVDMLGLSLLLLSIAVAGGSGIVDLNGQAVDVFATSAKVRVLVFLRTDCPISSRYAPELRRLHEEFSARGAVFSMVYADPHETDTNIRQHMTDYRFPGTPIRDAHHILVRRAKAAITPEAAVFSSAGALLYHGRIDNRYIEVGRSMPNPTQHDLEDAVAAALDGRPQPETTARAVGCYLADVE